LVDIEGETGFTELEELCQFNSDFPEGERISFKRLKLKLMVLLGSLLDAANRLLPGATVATLLMLGALHARRLYEDSKIEEQKRQGKELEFAPDWKVITSL
jgi:hypothetical protein